jgi:hypothetical protein
MHNSTLSNEQLQQTKGGANKRVQYRLCSSSYAQIGAATERTYTLPDGRVIQVQRNDNQTITVISDDRILNLGVKE